MDTELRLDATKRWLPAKVPETPGAYAGGLSLLVDRSALPYGRAGSLRFKILDEDGHTVRGFDMRHGGRMHLVVVRRRDLAHYRHLYPSMSLDGTWSAPLEFPEPGLYRAIADFSVAGVGRTLGADLPAPGSTEARPLPEPATTAKVDGYEVRLEAPPLAVGRGRRLEFRITRSGGGAVDLHAHFGAVGQLAALREGDLALARGRLLGATGGPAGDRTLTFELDPPGEGRYRLFLRFSGGGGVRTVGFTLEVGR
jgi:hypothetical protein